MTTTLERDLEKHQISNMMSKASEDAFKKRHTSGLGGGAPNAIKKFLNLSDVLIETAIKKDAREIKQLEILNKQVYALQQKTKNDSEFQEDISSQLGAFITLLLASKSFKNKTIQNLINSLCEEAASTIKQGSIKRKKKISFDTWNEFFYDYFIEAVFDFGFDGELSDEEIKEMADSEIESLDPDESYYDLAVTWWNYVKECEWFDQWEYDTHGPAPLTEFTSEACIFCLDYFKKRIRKEHGIPVGICGNETPTPRDLYREIEHYALEYCAFEMGTEFIQE